MELHHAMVPWSPLVVLLVHHFALSLYLLHVLLLSKWHLILPFGASHRWNVPTKLHHSPYPSMMCLDIQPVLQLSLHQVLLPFWWHSSLLFDASVQ
uniref:Uncharacterized protein n=1 Tax=Arundo donax TaxID=35708 RepID=A0A0A9FZJ7_ARUDO